jgi:hypothetical protein
VQDGVRRRPVVAELARIVEPAPWLAHCGQTRGVDQDRQEVEQAQRCVIDVAQQVGQIRLRLARQPAREREAA